MGLLMATTCTHVTFINVLSSILKSIIFELKFITNSKSRLISKSYYANTLRSFNSIDWNILIFLLLFLNVKLVVKLAAIVLICILQFNFKFGFRLLHSRCAPSCPSSIPEAADADLKADYFKIIRQKVLTDYSWRMLQLKQMAYKKILPEI